VIKKITVSFKPQQIPIDDVDIDYESDIDKSIDIERLILNLKDINEVQLLLLRFIGYDYKEIADIMNFKNTGEYYVLWRKLREDIIKLRIK